MQELTNNPVTPNMPVSLLSSYAVVWKLFDDKSVQRGKHGKFLTQTSLRHQGDVLKTTETINEIARERAENLFTALSLRLFLR